jgi:hypothetical protein
MLRKTNYQGLGNGKADLPGTHPIKQIRLHRAGPEPFWFLVGHICLKLAVFIAPLFPSTLHVLDFAAGHPRPGQTFRSGICLRCAPARRAICPRPPPKSSAGSFRGIGLIFREITRFNQIRSVSTQKRLITIVFYVRTTLFWFIAKVFCCLVETICF